jgi:CHAD domain-containing protein
MLSRGLSELPLVKAPMPSLAKDMSVDAAVREMTRACLVQIIGNASAVAGGLGGHEHVHQTRIGIRKLRTVLTVFGDLSPAVDPSWPDQLAAAFERLGATRDREVVLATWIGALAEAGAPDVDLPAVADDDAGAHLREPALSVLWLDLLGFVHGVPVESDADLETIISKRLRRLRRKALRSADGFRGLDAEAQHQIRKRVKRLRYVSELTAGLFPAKKVQKYVKKLAPAQEALGQLNDIGVAAEMFRTIAPEKAEAWFAVGWLSSRRAEAVEECLAPMHKAANAKPHWGKK